MLISHFSKHIFWSYKKDADLPEDIIIRQVVIYGEIEDIKKLTELIDKNKIKAVLKTMENKHEKRVNFIEKVIL